MAATRAAGTTGADGNGGADYPADGTADGGKGTGESAGPAAGAQPRSRLKAALDYCVPPPAGPRWLVVCLCAEWCGTCRDYRAPLRTVAADHPDHAFAWIDIEDDSELAGDLDIETFPTLLVLSGRQVMFYGPVLPGAESIRRLLRALDDNGAQPTALDAAVTALVERLC